MSGLMSMQRVTHADILPDGRYEHGSIIATSIQELCRKLVETGTDALYLQLWFAPVVRAPASFMEIEATASFSEPLPSKQRKVKRNV